MLRIECSSSKRYVERTKSYFCLRRYSAVTVCIALIIEALACCPVSAQVDPAQEPANLRVYALKYVSSELAVQVISSAAETSGVSDKLRMTAESRTNSIIIFGSESDHKIVASILTILDTQATNTELPEKVEALTAHTLSCVLIVERKADLRLADSISPTAETIKKILSDMEAKIPESKLQDPVVAISLATQVSPRLLPNSQTIAKNNPQPEIVKMNAGRFQLKGTSKEGARGLEIEGSLVGQNGQFLFSGQTVIQIERPAATEGQPPRTEVAKLSTDVVLQRNHPVVLSLTALDGQKCLVVLELQ